MQRSLSCLLVGLLSLAGCRATAPSGPISRAAGTEAPPPDAPVSAVAEPDPVDAPSVQPDAPPAPQSEPKARHLRPGHVQLRVRDADLARRVLPLFQEQAGVDITYDGPPQSITLLMQQPMPWRAALDLLLEFTRVRIRTENGRHIALEEVKIRLPSALSTGGGGGGAPSSAAGGGDGSSSATARSGPAPGTVTVASRGERVDLSRYLASGKTVVEFMAEW